MPSVTVEVDVNVDLDEFEDDSLIDELESRGYEVRQAVRELPPEKLQLMYEAARNGHTDIVMNYVSEMAWENAGLII